MARSDPDKLAQALRANLMRRKERMRSAQDGDATAPPPVLSGADEEGDVPPPVEGEKDGAWVSVGSKKA